MSPNKSNGEELLAQKLDAAGIVYTREVRFAPPRRWRFDFVLGHRDGKWAVEVEGGHWNGGHRHGAEADKDAEKSNAAVIGGWRVLRVTPRMVESGEALNVIEEALSI